MTEATIWHNPACGTSRNTLAIVRATGIWQLFAPASRRLFAATAAGAPNHAASGALAAQAAVIAGAAAHVVNHGATGALAAQSATLAGSAAHVSRHTTAGALAAQSATISGNAARVGAPSPHSASGALTAQSAAIAGSAVHVATHAATGALAAQSAAVAGTAAHSVAVAHATSGALAAQPSKVAGTAARFVAVAHAASGALVAQAAVISGGNRTTGAAPPAGGSKWPLVKKQSTQKLYQRKKIVDELNGIAEMFGQGFEGRLINPPPEVIPPQERMYSPLVRQMRAKWMTAQPDELDVQQPLAAPLGIDELRRKYMKKA